MVKKEAVTKSTKTMFFIFFERSYISLKQIRTEFFCFSSQSCLHRRKWRACAERGAVSKKAKHHRSGCQSSPRRGSLWPLTLPWKGRCTVYQLKLMGAAQMSHMVVYGADELHFHGRSPVVLFLMVHLLRA